MTDISRFYCRKLCCEWKVPSFSSIDALLTPFVISHTWGRSEMMSILFCIDSRFINFNLVIKNFSQLSIVLKVSTFGYPPLQMLNIISERPKSDFYRIQNNEWDLWACYTASQCNICSSHFNHKTSCLLSIMGFIANNKHIIM